eukprot:TRINITY_DN1427_c0_g1_i1.p2 TRINITY_DN1427_c0_g1~~TRINITY_DN1427_c0_g1_i1.p2  ORF type:complete len:115 (+),score=28.06 TRINITY_DN1427_c0_g1_i1:224-568(+)
MVGDESELEDTESLLPVQQPQELLVPPSFASRKQDTPLTAKCAAIRGALRSEMVEASAEEVAEGRLELIGVHCCDVWDDHVAGALNNDDFCLMLLSMWIGTAIVIFIYWIVFKM